MSPRHQRALSCRVCGRAGPEVFLRLGPIPLANALVFSTAPQPDEAFDLDVALCAGCGLVQCLDVIDPALLFTDYPYLTGVSETMRGHFRAYAADIGARLGGTGRVVEAGSNDGSLLEPLHEAGLSVLGVEPAANVAAVSRARGVETLISMFDEAAALKARALGGAADVVVANNVLAHVDDPVAFLRACLTLLAADGGIVIEVPDLVSLREATAWDTIYHEHLSYFSLGTLVALAERVGLAVESATPMPVHGGSLRVWLSRAPRHGAGVLEAVQRQRDGGIAALQTWQAFACAVARSCEALRVFVDEAAAAGKRVAGYGAPAKATVLLNHARLGPERVEYLVDRNRWKVGRCVPGTRTPILGTQALQTLRPDALIVFPWNLATEIASQERGLVEAGAALILPLPSPRALS